LVAPEVLEGGQAPPGPHFLGPWLYNMQHTFTVESSCNCCSFSAGL